MNIQEQINDLCYSRSIGQRGSMLVDPRFQPYYSWGSQVFLRRVRAHDAAAMRLRRTQPDKKEAANASRPPRPPRLAKRSSCSTPALCADDGVEHRSKLPNRTRMRAERRAQRPQGERLRAPPRAPHWLRKRTAWLLVLAPVVAPLLLLVCARGLLIQYVGE